MINFLVATLLFIIVCIFLVFLYRALTAPSPMYYTPEEETETTTVTTTTTTVTEPTTVTIDQLPTLERHFKPNGQPYVIDPVDKTEWMLNTNDDMYEDAADKWWRLVDATPKV